MNADRDVRMADPPAARWVSDSWPDPHGVLVTLSMTTPWLGIDDAV